MPEEKQSPNPGLSRADKPDFYANNVLLESSVWDLKMHFRQLDQGGNEANLEHRGTVTIPWLQAKLMAFYLQMNIDFHELDNGPIKVPANVMPLTPEGIVKTEPGQPIPPWGAIYKRLHEKFFGCPTKP